MPNPAETGKRTKTAARGPRQRKSAMLRPLSWSIELAGLSRPEVLLHIVGDLAEWNFLRGRAGPNDKALSFRATALCQA
jgi:hypothetical protein